jgi:hypothetical protein
MIALFALTGSALTARPAQAAPKPNPSASTPAVPITADGCQRFDQMKVASAAAGRAKFSRFSYNLAAHRCQVNSQAATRVDIRPQKDWAEPRDGIGMCNLAYAHAYAAPNDWLNGRTEDRCVADWLEYLLYLQAHPQCVKQANADLDRQLRSNPAFRERPDLRQTCNDPAFGAHEVYKGKTAAQRQNQLIGSLSLAGWVFCGAIALLIGGGIAAGWKYQQH